MNAVVRARLTGRAARFLDMLRDFGHLDEVAIEQMVLALAEGNGDRERVIDLPAVRRMAAAVLYAREPSFGEVGGPLAEDWAFLFQ